MTVMSGADILIKSLLAENVEVIFGYPGGKVIHIYDLLYESPIKHYLARHEQGAIHAADGYARSTGRVGVCIATSGPGATNLVTGLANAYMDSVPVVAFTGQVATSQIGKDSFQEADIKGITMPVTKHNYLVTDVNDLAKTIKDAFYIAKTGRPGPVLIDLPVDVVKAEAEYSYPAESDLPGYKPTYKGHSRQVKLAAEKINKAKKPVIFAGGGVIISEAAEELKELALKGNIPVITSLMGLGSFPGDDQLSLGMPGMHGTRYANYAFCETDLIIAIGTRFDDRVTGRLDKFASQAEVIHIDIDPAEISKNVEILIPIVGDAKNIVRELLPLIKDKDRKEWLSQIDDWKKSHPLKYNNNADEILPQSVIESIYKITEGEALIVTEVGQHQMWAAQFYKYSKPRTFFSSGGLGTMGYGLPAAYGVQIGRPDKTVVNISGDGSFQMNLQELATISNYKIPVKTVILNNGTLGMVRQWQELFFEKRYSATMLDNPDFVKLAEAFGIFALRIEEKEDLLPALNKAFEYEGPVLLDIKVAQEENVFPMVPAGAGIKDMIGG
ncbi:biosynthetic-type acetolactate synthase large subunit [Halocella sp. SP3-1]|nr:biosynthetic-type acetolactate synthase large subunit [Halocella sp. SP3-1]